MGEAMINQQVVIAIVISLTGAACTAQTRVSSDQMTLPQLVTQEERWCPGPIMRVSEDRLSMTIGLNWSNTRPCYMHFNLTPPVGVDPVSITSFVEPFTISIKPGFVGDDDVYLFAVAPTFTPAVANSKIGIRVKSSLAVTCGSCGAGVVVDTRIPRMFPASTVPIGFAAIRGGKFLPKPDELLARQQIYIGPGAEMTVIPDQGGYVFQLNPAAVATQRAVDAANALKTTAALAVTRSMAMTPVPDKELQVVKATVNQLAVELRDVQTRVPPDSGQVQALMQRFEEAGMNAQQGASSIIEASRMSVEEATARMLYSASERVSVPTSSDESCATHQWAQDGKYLYRCIPALQGQAPGSWVRYVYNGKFGKSAR